MNFINIIKNNILPKKPKSHKLQATVLFLPPNKLQAKKLLLRGFTLLESLVAISILMIAVASPMTIAQKGLSSAIHAKDQIVASYLAQDAIEYIINWSDQNVAADTTRTGPSAMWLNTISSQCGTLCTVDTREPYGSGIGIQSCNDVLPIGGDGICDDKPPLNYYSTAGTTERIYTYTGETTSLSPFTRSVKVTETVSGVEALITVTVSWNDKGANTKLVFNTRIFNWK